MLTLSNILVHTHILVVESAAAPAASKLAKVTLSQFAEPKTDLIIHFSEDDDALDVTLVVWDFGGQKVSCTIYTSGIRLIMMRPTPRSSISRGRPVTSSC